MFLKSLVLRGFKSFADKTALVFEPGISIVVGPNGSGKTNVVDAVSWVLGEQGPRSLRGGKMEDVIFAGSRLRPALGMAEVSMTIDNTAGLLPIDFTEVTITRSLFRSGESEYKINGAPCRLLDIQELLSDTGIGREQHTIIGQGQLDAILTADPLQMRGSIEEAAGVAKHRRRKDRALRKIASTEQNLVRLSDLLSEIRRQLRPLREQAEVARKHASIAEELDRVRLVLGARELADIRTKLGPGGVLDLDAPIREKESELTRIEQDLTAAERRRSEFYAACEVQRDAAWALSRGHERLLALVKLATERSKTLDAELATTTEAAAQARVLELQREIKELRQTLVTAEAESKSAEKELETKRSSHDAVREEVKSAEEAVGPLRAQHRETMAEAVKVRGEIAAVQATVEAAERERARLQARASALSTAIEDGVKKLTEARAKVSQLESAEAPLVTELQEIEEELVRLEQSRSSAFDRLRSAEREAVLLVARADQRANASPAAAARVASLAIPGVAGVLSEIATISPQYKRALEAIAGPIDCVLVVADRSAASAVIAALAPTEGAGILIAAGTRPVVGEATALLDFVETTNPDVENALTGVYVAASSSEAASLAASHPNAVFVAKDGSLAFGRVLVKTPSDFAQAADAATVEVNQAQAALDELEIEVVASRRRREEVMQKLNEADAEIAAAGERLSGLEREVHALEREMGAVTESRERAAASVTELTQRLAMQKESIPALEHRLEELSSDLESARERLRDVESHSETASKVYDDARMAAAKCSERLRLLEDRNASLEAALSRAMGAAAGVEGRRAHLQLGVKSAASISNVARKLADAAAGWAKSAEEDYGQSRASLERTDGAIADLRTERSARAGALDDMRVRAREEDLERSELKIRARIIEERMHEEWQVDPEETTAKYGHVWEVEDDSRLTEPIDKLAATDGEALTRRRTKLERDLTTMGTVNPLAEQEFESLTDREEFLTAQIADVRSSRRDLFKVVTSVDDQIRDLFGKAFEDVAREYERLFVMLFPGGQGRLRMTDPNDLLQTGVEVEARPGGKNLRRLSLLSGGEKALSALAFLFAIFRARPSPFYVLDEVEAALDDVNLHRFLGLLREFRQSSQLIVVTHQKRTMEVADILYGVSIRPDGATRIISEKLSDVTPTAHEMRGRADVPQPME